MTIQTRKAAVAGQFYPSNPDELRAAITSFTPTPASPESRLPAKAVIVPHAGYIYSGRVAGRVFSSAILPRRFLLLGPNHSGRGAALALAPAGLWSTPLGDAVVDQALNMGLTKTCPRLQEDESAHRNEHCLEVQIPFLQVLRQQFTFSAICIRTIEYQDLEKLGQAIGRVIAVSAEPILIVVSSDMTHYENADAAAEKDRLALSRILALDAKGLYRTVLEHDITMCGFAPAVAALIACRELGADSGRLIQYANSGEVSGDCERVVAYAGVTIQ